MAIIPADQPEEGIDSYGGKDFEKRKVLRREGKTAHHLCDMFNAGNSISTSLLLLQSENEVCHTQKIKERERVASKYSSITTQKAI